MLLLLLLHVQAAVCCLLPLAFCLLGDTAEFYIAPIMAHVSQAIPKMRPRFAGGTGHTMMPCLPSSVAVLAAACTQCAYACGLLGFAVAGC